MPDLVGAALTAGSLARREQPVLTVAELTLRPWLNADAPAVVGAYDDPDISFWHGRSMAEDEVADWVGSWSQRWLQETGAGWAVTDGTLAPRSRPTWRVVQTCRRPRRRPRSS